MTLALNGGDFDPGSTVSAVAVNGVATFNNLVIDTLSSCTLTASDGTLTGATSGSFVIEPTLTIEQTSPSQEGSQTAFYLRMDGGTPPPAGDLFNFDIDWHDGTPDTQYENVAWQSILWDVSHEYDSIGSHTVQASVQLVGQEGWSSTWTQVSVTPLIPILQSIPNLVLAGGDFRPQIGLAQTVPCETYTVSVDWGDGTTTQADTQQLSVNGDCVNAQHTYAVNRDYTATYTVSDEPGGASSQLQVLYQVVKPVLTLTYCGGANQDVELTLGYDRSVTQVGCGGSWSFDNWRTSYSVLANQTLTVDYPLSAGQYQMEAQVLAFGESIITATPVDTNTLAFSVISPTVQAVAPPLAGEETQMALAPATTCPPIRWSTPR